MKTCKRCFREFDKEEVFDVSPASELADYLDSRFHGNDRGDHGNDREDRGNDRGETDVGVEEINDLCSECREELGVMNLLGFGE